VNGLEKEVKRMNDMEKWEVEKVNELDGLETPEHTEISTISENKTCSIEFSTVFLS
jgi:hypothetical protein